jgi:hypothetical protein
MQTPSIGRIVHTATDQVGNNGGDVAPAVITRVFSDGVGGWMVNLRVLLDGPETPWRTSVYLTEEPSTDDRTCWYPPRV